MVKNLVLTLTLALTLSGCSTFDSINNYFFEPERGVHAPPSNYVWADTESYIKELEEAEKKAAPIIENIEVEFFIPFQYGKAWRPTYQGHKTLKSITTLDDVISVTLTGYSVSKSNFSNSPFATKRANNVHRIIIDMNKSFNGRIFVQESVLENKAVNDKTGVLLKLVMPG